MSNQVTTHERKVNLQVSRTTAREILNALENLPINQLTAETIYLVSELRKELLPEITNLPNIKYVNYNAKTGDKICLADKICEVVNSYQNGVDLKLANEDNSFVTSLSYEYLKVNNAYFTT